MATAFQDRAPARRKVTTYGKAAKKRVPEFTFSSMARQSDLGQASKEVVVAPSLAPVTSRSTTPSKLKSTAARRSASRTPSIPDMEDIYDVPDSEDDLPTVIRKKSPTPPPKTKPKPIRQKPVLKTALSNASSTSDIWDVPDEPAPKPIRQRATTPLKLKPRQRKSPSITPPSTSLRKSHVFDVPSSDDEKAATSAKRSLKTMQKPAPPNSLGTVDSSDRAIEGSKKKLRLSPAPDFPSKRPLQRMAPRPPRSHPATNIKQNRNNSPRAGQVTMMVARPKIHATDRRPEPARTLQRFTPEPHLLQATSSTPSGSGSDIDMIDIAAKQAHISPRGMQIWQDLMDSVEATEEESSSGRAKASKSGKTRPIPPSSHSGILSRPAGVSKVPHKSARILPRRRLIDSLVEQTQEESESDSSDDSSELMTDSMPASQQSVEPMEVLEIQNLLQETAHPQPIATDSQVSQVGPRITYTRVRSMLDEQDIMMDLQMGLPTQSMSENRRPRRVDVPGMKPLPSFHAVEDDDNTVSAIRSVHELRLAGANNRFLDEVQDFLERIGSPAKTPSAASMRRSGLLDLASKMKDKAFSKQFRDNGVEQRLFLHLGQESDIISGFIMMSLLISVLTEGNMPHIVPQLRRHGITRLIIRLLECESTIVAISKERKSNMSKVAQALLAEHQDYLLHMPIWEDLLPDALSPRTLALKCLEAMVRQTREAGLTSDILSKELTTNLFAITNTASDVRCWDLPKSKQAIDFYLAVSALESHSITARTLHDETIWISDYLPIIASTLEVALARPSETYGKIQVLLLRLTLNVTNNNREGSEIFTKPMLMSTMAQAVVMRFKMILRFLTEEELDTILEHLVLILGVMINFAECSSAARESLQGLQGQEDDPLGSIIQIFTENREKTSMVSCRNPSTAILELRHDAGRLYGGNPEERGIWLPVCSTWLPGSPALHIQESSADAATKDPYPSYLVHRRIHPSPQDGGQPICC
jgi:hypothetical protein